MSRGWAPARLMDGACTVPSGEAQRRGAAGSWRPFPPFPVVSVFSVSQKPGDRSHERRVCRWRREDEVHQRTEGLPNSIEGSLEAHVVI